MSSFSSATNQQRTGPVAELAPQQKSLDVHGGGSGSGGSSTTTSINNNNTSANANASTTGSSSSNTNTSNINNGDNITTGGRQRTQSGHHAQDQLSKTNLYIRGLQTTTKDQDLHDMCNRFGHISSTKAIMDKATGCCRGYGFVEFVNAKSAELAVRELTKSGVQAQMAKVTSSYSSHGGGGANGSRGNNHQMNHHNNNGGQNQKSNRNSGFSSSNSSNNNLHHNSGSSQHNHNNSPSSNPSHKNNADPTNLYIANLPPNMSEPELEELLSNYGHIVSTRILRDESNNPRGVGFARMESRDKCEEIIEQLNGRPYKGSAEPLVVKFADGGNKKRHHYNNHQYHHHHHHHNNNHNSNNNNNGHHNLLSHQNHNKAVNQVDEARWQEDANAKDLTCVQSYEHHHQPQVNMSHSNQPTDLPMMGAIRIQPGYPPSIATGGPYGPPPLGPPTSAPQWMHQAGGQPYVVQQQMTQTGGLSPPNQAAAAAAAAAMHYGHIPHLAAQMQGLQITHTPAHAVGGYLAPQHQWPTLWPHPIPQQSPSPMGRLSTGPPMQQQPGPPQPPMQGQHSSKMTPVQQTPLIHQSQPQRLAGQQQQQQHHQQPHHQQQQQQVNTTIENKIHVSVPL